MKCMIAFACLLAVASAGYVNNAVVSAYGVEDDGSYKGEFYNGALGYNGIYGSAYGGAYAGALGYAQGSKAVAYNAPIVSAPHPVHVAQTYASPIVQGYAHGYAKSVAPFAYSGYGASPIAYSGYAAPIGHAYGYGHAAPLVSEARLVDPVAIAAGAPLPTGDTVEVAAAKAVHYQAHAAAKGVAYSAIQPALAYSGYAASPIAYSGYAHASPIAYSGYAHGYAHAGLASEARLVDPVAIAAGAPLPTGDTVEVAAAKAFHHQAHVEAKTGHLLAKGHFITKRSPGLLATGFAAPLAYSAPAHSYGYSSYASPLAYSGYSGYTGYGYGGHLGAYYG